MGQNIILNAADHGFNVIAFNRTTSKVDRFLENEAKGMITSIIVLFLADDESAISDVGDYLQESPLRVLTPWKNSAPS